MSWGVTAGVSTALVAFVCAGASGAASEGGTSSGAASIEICPDPARLGGTPIAIGLQLGLVSKSGIDRPLVTAPSIPGRFVWSATVTRLRLSDAELRCIVELPQRARFRAKAVHGSVRITGRVVAHGKGLAKSRLDAFVTGQGRRFIVMGYSRADGRFTLSHRLGRGTFTVRVNTVPEDRDVTATECGGGACTSATKMILGLQAAPGTIRVRSTGPPRTAPPTRGRFG